MSELGVLAESAAHGSRTAEQVAQRFVTALLARDRDATIAQFEIYLEAARRSELQDEVKKIVASFVDEFLHWADAQHLFAAVTWDSGAWAVTGGAFPKAAAALHAIDEAGAIAPEAKAIDS